MKDIAIFGAGGLGREIALLIRQLNQKEPFWNLLGFFDEKPFGGLVDGLPYLGGLSEANSCSSELHLVIGIGNCAAKFRIANSLSSPNLRFPNLIHPSVSLSGQQYFQIGQGTIIGEGTVITTNVRLGSFVQISPRCTLAHDVQIADFCSLMFSVNLAGNVKLKPRVYLGTNSTVIQLLEIGEDTIVGAGAVVIRSLPDRCTAAGVPAKIIKTHEIPA